MHVKSIQGNKENTLRENTTHTHTKSRKMEITHVHIHKCMRACRTSKTCAYVCCGYHHRWCDIELHYMPIYAYTQAPPKCPSSCIIFLSSISRVRSLCVCRWASMGAIRRVRDNANESVSFSEHGLIVYAGGFRTDRRIDIESFRQQQRQHYTIPIHQHIRRSIKHGMAYPTLGCVDICVRKTPK